MGRKAKFQTDEEERPTKGKGRKSKKQSDPEAPFEFTKKELKENNSGKKLTHRQKQRAARRAKKKEEWKEKRRTQKEKRKQKSSENQNTEIPELKKKKKVTEEQEEEAFESYDEMSDEEDTYKVEKLADVRSDTDDGEDDDDENDDDENTDEVQGKKKKDDDLRLNIASEDVFVFPKDDDITALTSIPEVEQRIKDVLLVLSQFKKFRDPCRSRQEYISLLRKDLCSYFSYNEFLMERIMNIFPLDELMGFLEASESQRPVTIRTNSLKIRRRDLAHALINRGVNVDPIGEWTNVGLVVYDSPVPIGATPEYLAGFYMLQAASSMLPVIALAPKENERILDLCAAPGGKASHIAALMKNTGTLFANDSNRSRVNGIVGNFHRLGIMNAVITNYDGRVYPKVMKGFNRVLVDAPCTGTGVISKDPSVKTSKDATDVQRCFTLQRELALAAVDCCSSGGYIVYSTCSILPEENEAVVNYILRKRDVVVVDTGLDFGVEGFVNFRDQRFHPSMKLTKRVYAHTHNMDGFFVAKCKKLSDRKLDEKKEPEEMIVD